MTIGNKNTVLNFRLVKKKKVTPPDPPAPGPGPGPEPFARFLALESDYSDIMLLESTGGLLTEDQVEIA